MKKTKIFGMCILILATLLLTTSSAYAGSSDEVYKKVPNSYYDDYYTTPDRIMATNSKTQEYVILQRSPSYKAFSVHGKTKIVNYDVTNNRTVITDNRGNLIEERKLNLQELSNALEDTRRKTGDQSFKLDIPNLPKPTNKEVTNNTSNGNVKNDVASKEKIKDKVEVKKENKTEIKQDNKKEETKSEDKLENNKDQNKVEDNKQEDKVENNKDQVKNNEKAKSEEGSNKEKDDIENLNVVAKPSTSSNMLTKVGVTVASLGVILIAGIIILARVKAKKK